MMEEEVEMEKMNAMDIYRESINTAFLKATECSKLQRFEELVSFDKHVRIFETMFEGKKTFKIEVLMQKSAHDIVKLYSNHHWETRFQWDKSILKCELLEHYTALDISLVHHVFPKKRCLLGLFWSRYNNLKQTYTCILTALKDGLHDRYALPAGLTHMNDFWQVVHVKHIDDQSAFFTMYSTCCNILDKIVFIYFCKALEETSNDAIFEQWECGDKDKDKGKEKGCGKMNEPHLLECRYCGKYRDREK